MVARHWHRVLLGYVLVVLTVPLVPVYPLVSLDPSWGAAINKAVIHHLVFGREVIFTYGPYGSIFTGAFDPHLMWLPLLGGAVLATGTIIAVFVLVGDRRLLAVGLTIVIALGLVTREMIGPIFPLLAVQALIRAGDQPPGWPRTFARVRSALVVAPLGLLPLIKVSTLPVVALALVVGCWILIARRRFDQLLILILVPPVAGALLWVIIGQPLGALFAYPFTTLPLVSGYSEAMALHPGTSHALLVVAALLALSVLSVVASRRAWVERIPLSLQVLGTGFLVFKAAFVREDVHTDLTIGAVLAIALVVALDATPKWSTATVSLGVLVACLMTYFSVAMTPSTMKDSLHGTFVTAPHALIDRFVRPGDLRQTYRHAVAVVRAYSGIRHPGPDVDVYSYGQAGLFAAGGGWNPRPVFQSYSVYTPGLAARNADHLVGASAPQRVLFRVEPIDERLPALEDGSSWMRLWDYYRLDAFNPTTGYATLDRRSGGAAGITYGRTVVLHGRIGTTLALPTGSVWEASFDVTQTPLGRLRTLLAWPPTVWITAGTAAGDETFLFVPEMARAPFVLSPLVTTTAQFAWLATGGATGSAPHETTSVTITTSGAPTWWNSGYTVTLRELVPVRVPVD